MPCNFKNGNGKFLSRHITFGCLALLMSIQGGLHADEKAPVNILDFFDFEPTPIPSAEKKQEQAQQIPAEESNPLKMEAQKSKLDLDSSYVLDKNGSIISQVVSVTGMGTTLEEAKRNAFSLAVQQVVGTLVDVKRVAENDRISLNRILTLSGGYIDKYEVIAQGLNATGLYEMGITALVKRNELVDRMRNQQVPVTDEVEGESLFAKAYTQQEMFENAEKMLKALFDKDPRRFKVKITKPLEVVNMNELTEYQLKVSRTWVKLGLSVAIDDSYYNEVFVPRYLKITEALTGHVSYQNLEEIKNLSRFNKIIKEDHDKEFAVGGLAFDHEYGLIKLGYSGGYFGVDINPSFKTTYFQGVSLSKGKAIIFQKDKKLVCAYYNASSGVQKIIKNIWEESNIYKNTYLNIQITLKNNKNIAVKADDIYLRLENLIKSDYGEDRLLGMVFSLGGFVEHYVSFPPRLISHEFTCSIQLPIRKQNVLSDIKSVSVESSLVHMLKRLRLDQ
jgi:hypothetical protein